MRDEELHNSGINDNAKNRAYELHSTANPLYGSPTVPQCFNLMKKLLNITLLTENTVLSNDFPLHQFNNFEE